MNSAPTFPCPQCATEVAVGSPACPACGLRLVGPDAARLWQVNQQIGQLKVEAEHLLTRLRQPAAAGAPAAAPGPYAAPYPAPYPAPTTGPHQGMPVQPRKALSGQQVLLGLGALLLLSGVSFFLLVVWLVVGVAGQALIMLTLTGTSVALAAEGTRRRMPAVAETFAVIASGLLLIDLWAAHGLNLLGLGSWPTDGYWAGAGLFGGLLLLGFDNVMPRLREKAPLRPVFIFRPAATSLFAVSGISLVSALDPDALTLCALAAVLTLACAGGVLLAKKLDRPVPDTVVDGVEVRGRHDLGPLPWSAVPLLVVGASALLVHVLAGMVVGYDPDSTGADRYLALVLLLVVSGCAVGLRFAPASLVPDRVRGAMDDLAILAAIPAVGIALADAHRWVLVGVAGAVAVAVVAELALRGGRTSTAGLLGWVLLPILTFAVWVMTESASVDGLALLAGRSGEPAEWWLPVLPAAAWAAAALAAVLLTRALAWSVLAQVTVLVTLFMLVRDADVTVQVVVALVACAGSFALAGFVRSLPESRDLDLVDGVAAVLAGLYGLVAIVLSVDESALLTSAAFVTVGACTLAYAGSRGRIGLAYPGSLLVTAGTSVLLNEADVQVVEVYTAPLVLLLAGIGLVQWHRDRTAPTMLTMGPAVGAALLPSTMVAIEEGHALRLAAVSLVAIAVLVGGLAQHWRAPVTVAAVALALVALTQGGPLMEYVSGWVILIGSGALLLAIGIAWEKAVLAGRRTASWYATLR